MLGKLLALPVRLLNVPMRATEKFVASAMNEEDEIGPLSAPLESVAKAIEEAGALKGDDDG